MTAQTQVDAARIALRRAMASALARKETAEAELTRIAKTLEGRRGDLTLAESAADVKLVGQIRTIIDDLHAQADLHRSAVTLADEDLAALKDEWRELQASARSAGLAIESPPTASGSAVDQTLDRVRDSIAELDIEASLGSSDTDVRRTDAAAADALARAKLAELKAAKLARGSSGTSSSDADDADDVPSSSKPKRTL